MPRPGLPLADFHARHGARPGDGPGEFDVPLDYGDWEEEYRTARDSWSLWDRSWVGRLEVRGEDRARFLNGLVTCDVHGLEPGRGVYGFFTDARGRILSDVAVLALEDRLHLEVEAGAARRLVEHLERYIITEPVLAKCLAPAPLLALVGPEAGEVLGGLGVGTLPEAELEHRSAALGGVETRIVRRRRLGREAFELWPAPETAEKMLEELLAAGGGEAGRLLGLRAAEALRVEAGEPRSGQDFGPDHLPQETGLETAVSYTKGCYLGQEVVARIHYRGKVNRRLVGIRLADRLPPVPAPVEYEGRLAGTLTSAARSPALGASVGLATLQVRAAAPGTEVVVGGTIAAEVVAVPFPDV